ncbi:MAG: hypothetical protein JST21_18855 [Bacteroidetes bacterium]|nr:hypothetical protein [Bacteroidota bacterium]MBS1748225.1 hypothetical protein [Bacteroidota bacterium]
MGNQHNYGEIISKKKANELIDNRDKLVERVKPLLRTTTVTSGDLSFYDNNYNAFVFSRELIEKLFKNTPAENGQELDVLLVAMASEIDTKKNQRPTVVLAACTSTIKNGKITVTAPKEDLSMLETPPAIMVQEIKLNGDFIFSEK